MALYLTQRRGLRPMGGCSPEFQNGWRIPLKPPIEFSNIKVA
jgi:hypothetical protein